MQQSAFTAYLMQLLFLLPIFIAAIAGIVWSGINWKKSFTPALAGLIACTVLLLFSCIFPALRIWMPQMVMGQNPGPDFITRLNWTHYIISFSTHLCTALCLGGLIFAAFAERAASSAKKKDKKKRDRDEEDEDDDRPRKKKTADDEETAIERPAPKKRSRVDDDD